MANDDTTLLPGPRGPSTDSRRPFAVLGAAIAVVLLTGVVVAIADDDGAVRTGATATTAAATAAAAADGTTPTSGPAPSTGSADDEVATGPAPESTPAPAGQPSPTTAGEPAPVSDVADLGEPRDPGPARPPAPGRYRYRVEGDASSSDGQQTQEDGEGTTTITEQSRDDGVVRQTVELEGQGIDGTETVEWHDDRVLVTRSVFRFGSSTGDCDWEPDHLQAVLPLASGTTWSSESSCEVTGFGLPVTVTRSSTSEVTDLVRRRIAGEVLDLRVIETHEDLRFATTRVQIRITSWFSPRHGLVVASEGEAEGGDGAMTGDGSFSTELLDLEPEPV